MMGVHQSDFVGQWGVQQMGVAVDAGLPFFVHLTPLMCALLAAARRAPRRAARLDPPPPLHTHTRARTRPHPHSRDPMRRIHYGVCYGPLPKGETNNITDPFWEKDLTQWGCSNKQNKPCSLSISPCVSTKNERAFDGHVNPHTPAWNVSAMGPLPSAMDLNDLSAFTSNRQDIGFRNRSAALLDLDALLGVVLDGIQALGVEDNTYVIFTVSWARPPTANQPSAPLNEPPSNHPNFSQT